ncbi:DUF4328 domain-containing protein [Streptomyces sp. H10-C2]|uniref:protein kinase domain-containing protein n=1 Tax=unclassified Streptomyces TaxID=2593676 RepID=UPI0024B8FE6D|nr:MULTISPECIES: DUF4328 domain-containing protein [unclassified Streptomyces]MDJ0342663.1 DUF4328 domain-containing protein [Streptomyces sp. PH10-H1]MDJ0368483.1 DUF4328 domain-containing protein [Streptomyces sp. H10-C2]
MEELSSEDPQWIGSYRLLRRLGAGGMGRVFLARSERGRTVAVKLVKGELAAQPEFRRRFQQEVRAARRVGGEWTAPVLDADTEAAVPWVATGYIAGPTLHEVVAGGHGPLPERSVRVLASGLAKALRDIHAAGLIHRDVKPSNILITIDGPRVIDFGIARALETVADGLLTRTGAVIGSPGFMSPEQVRGERVTPASDVFCLGAVLAYAATGHMPFGNAEGGVHALMFRIANDQPDLGGLSDGPLRDLIADCLTKDPERRPSPDELVDRTSADAGASGPWLPGELLAQLGRHAVRLLEAETPQATAGPAPAPAATPATAPAPQEFGPSPYGPEQAFHRPGEPHPKPLTVKSPRNLSTLLTLLICALMLGLVVNLNFEIELFRKLVNYITGAADFTNGEVNAQKTRFLKMAALFGAILVPTVVVWLAWFRRVRANAEAFAPEGQRLGRGWAIGAWFVPVAHLWIPKQISNDIWTASDPGSHAYGQRRAGASRGVLHLWWLTWALQCASLYVSWFWRTWYDADYADEAKFIVKIGIAQDVLALVSSVLAILVVQRITSMQERRAAASPQASSSPYPPAYAAPYGPAR